MSETHIPRNTQPTAITADLKGGVLAKLTYDPDTGEETWSIGRVKDVPSRPVFGPDGQAQPSTVMIKWQIGLNGRGFVYDLHL